MLLHRYFTGLCLLLKLDSFKWYVYRRCTCYNLNPETLKMWICSKFDRVWLIVLLGLTIAAIQRLESCYFSNLRAVTFQLHVVCKPLKNSFHVGTM